MGNGGTRGGTLVAFFSHMTRAQHAVLVVAAAMLMGCNQSAGPSGLTQQAAGDRNAGGAAPTCAPLTFPEGIGVIAFHYAQQKQFNELVALKHFEMIGIAGESLDLATTNFNSEEVFRSLERFIIGWFPEDKAPVIELAFTPGAVAAVVAPLAPGKENRLIVAKPVTPPGTLKFFDVTTP
jgi:hypothetical protein